MIRAHVGVGPKHLARTARMQRAVTFLQRQPHANVADVAAATGYFDQAHMAGDFRTLVGASPRSVFDARGSIFPIPSLFLRA
jgi:transcriptional regulator GlxA family with amidase domain